MVLNKAKVTPTSFKKPAAKPSGQKMPQKENLGEKRKADSSAGATEKRPKVAAVKSDQGASSTPKKLFTIGSSVSLKTLNSKANEQFALPELWKKKETKDAVAKLTSADNWEPLSAYEKVRRVTRLLKLDMPEVYEGRKELFKKPSQSCIRLVCGKHEWYAADGENVDLAKQLAYTEMWRTINNCIKGRPPPSRPSSNYGQQRGRTAPSNRRQPPPLMEARPFGNEVYGAVKGSLLGEYPGEAPMSVNYDYYRGDQGFDYYDTHPGMKEPTEFPLQEFHDERTKQIAETSRRLDNIELRIRDCLTYEEEFTMDVHAAQNPLQYEELEGSIFRMREQLEKLYEDRATLKAHLENQMATNDGMEDKWRHQEIEQRFEDDRRHYAMHQDYRGHQEAPYEGRGHEETPYDYRGHQESFYEDGGHQEASYGYRGQEEAFYEHRAQEAAFEGYGDRERQEALRVGRDDRRRQEDHPGNRGRFEDARGSRGGEEAMRRGRGREEAMRGVKGREEAMRGGRGREEAMRGGRGREEAMRGGRGREEAMRGGRGREEAMRGGRGREEAMHVGREHEAIRGDGRDARHVSRGRQELTREEAARGNRYKVNDDRRQEASRREHQETELSQRSYDPEGRGPPETFNESRGRPNQQTSFGSDGMGRGYDNRGSREEYGRLPQNNDRIKAIKMVIQDLKERFNRKLREAKNYQDEKTDLIGEYMAEMKKTRDPIRQHVLSNKMHVAKEDLKTLLSKEIQIKQSYDQDADEIKKQFSVSDLEFESILASLDSNSQPVEKRSVERTADTLRSEQKELEQRIGDLKRWLSDAKNPEMVEYLRREFTDCRSRLEALNAEIDSKRGFPSNQREKQQGSGLLGDYPKERGGYRQEEGRGKFQPSGFGDSRRFESLDAHSSRQELQSKQYSGTWTQQSNASTRQQYGSKDVYDFRRSSKSSYDDNLASRSTGSQYTQKPYTTLYGQEQKTSQPFSSSFGQDQKTSQWYNNSSGDRYANKPVGWADKAKVWASNRGMQQTERETSSDLPGFSSILSSYAQGKVPGDFSW